VLRCELHDTERAVVHARAVVTRAQGSPGLLLQAATVLLSLGHEVEARRAADQVLAASPHASVALWLDVASLYRGAGDYAAAEALYARVLALDPAHTTARLAVGTLCAWRGDATAAHAHAEAVLAAHPDSAPALCLRGAVRMLTGEVVRALDDLDRATALDPGDPVAAVWRGEALLRLGRSAEALQETRRGGERADDISDHVAAQILISLAQLRVGEFPGLPEFVLRPALAVLWTEAAGAALLPADGLVEEPDRGALEALFEGALERLRGNRSPVATYVRPDGALVRLAVPSSPRVASKRALWRFVATGSRDEVLAELDRVHALVPCAAEPYNYRGELFLYLGEPAAARREFERAITLYGRSRWAYIGLAGAAVIEGKYEEALASLAEGIVQAGAPGPTTFVYRGEALRCLGRADEARADLTVSVRKNPGRIGAWVNLGLLDVSAGDDTGVRRTFAVLRRRAPGFVADAAQALDLDPAADLGTADIARFLAEMLTMLRGNRASSCVTYFTRDGRLRAVPPSTDTEI
jgi:tetratricopeptide (TPR) repeat protein